MVFSANIAVLSKRGVEISFFPQPLLKLPTQIGPPVASNGLSCTYEIAYVTQKSFRGTYNSNFLNDSFYITRNDFLVSSKPPRRNPYLKAVDYVIHGKLRDSQGHCRDYVGILIFL